MFFLNQDGDLIHLKWDKSAAALFAKRQKPGV
jgi:hypothetical protein